MSLTLGGAPCQCAAWGSEAGGHCDASIAKRNIKWEGRETKKLDSTLLSDELGFWYSPLQYLEHFARSCNEGSLKTTPAPPFRTSS